MEKHLLPISIVGLVLVAATFLTLEGGTAALLLTALFALIAIWIFRVFSDQKSFITGLFLLALLLRLAFGLIVHMFDLRDFFGGDANTYDYFGNEVYLRWINAAHTSDPIVQLQLDNPSPGWGIHYVVAAIYYFVGRNILAAQCFCGVIGAATAPMVYFCAQRMYQNDRVAKTSALLVAVFPAFIIWSGQLLKDGLIVFLLVLAMTMVLELQRKFSYAAVSVLVLSIAAILPLRFYIFFMLAPAVIGSFILGLSQSAKAVIRNTVILVILGLGLTYLGATRNAGSALEQYGSLASIQTSRQDLATSAASGFASDIDVSSTGGAIGAIPVGLTYLMLAPFPWEVSSFRSAITVPEVLIWWAMVPVIIFGIGWTLKNKLQHAFPILIFSLMLTLAYSIFLGNVGTAYRQRTQIQVFLFMFFAVGWTLRKEKKENERIRNAARARHFREERARQLAGVRGQPI
jgi:hypothetical protein